MSPGARHLAPAPTFFPTPAKFRAWLSKNHAKAAELWVGYYKRESGRPSVTWPETVREALCFGWIDGVRKSYTDESYVVRFSPRNPGSRWSELNLKYFDMLSAAGLVTPAGRQAHEARDHKRSGYAVRRHKADFDAATLKVLKADRKAWAYFQTLPPGYSATVAWWLAEARKPETRARRLERFLAVCRAGKKLID